MVIEITEDERKFLEAALSGIEMRGNRNQVQSTLDMVNGLLSKLNPPEQTKDDKSN